MSQPELEQLKVLDLLLSMLAKCFSQNSFLIALGSEGRISEIYAMYKYKNLLNCDDYPLWARINLTLKPLAKDEMVEFGNELILIQSWKISPLQHHSFYPFKTQITF